MQRKLLWKWRGRKLWRIVDDRGRTVAWKWLNGKLLTLMEQTTLESDAVWP